MNNETVIAVLMTVVILLVAGGLFIWLRSFLNDRRVDRQMYINRLTEQSEINKGIHAALRAVQDDMKEVTAAITISLKESSAEMTGVISALDDSFSARTEVFVKALDPEVSKKFTASVDRLTEMLAKHAADIERFGDSGALMASSCRKLNDNITALRGIVYGGRRAEEFASTVDDPEAIRRADIESEVVDLMRDHNMPRPEAERRVRQLYSTRPM